MIMSYGACCWRQAGLYGPRIARETFDRPRLVFIAPGASCNVKCLHLSAFRSITCATTPAARFAILPTYDRKTNPSFPPMPQSRPPAPTSQRFRLVSTPGENPSLRVPLLFSLWPTQRRALHPQCPGPEPDPPGLSPSPRSTLHPGRSDLFPSRLHPHLEADPPGPVPHAAGSASPAPLRRRAAL